MAKKKTSSKKSEAVDTQKKTAKKSKKSDEETPAQKKSKKSDEEVDGVEAATRGRKKEKSDDAPEGQTLATQESGRITFKDGSGSQDLNLLIAKHGFDREKVLEEAEELRKAGKMFHKADPVKKYTKVAGIIKALQKEGFKLMTSKAAQKAIDALEVVEEEKPSNKEVKKAKKSSKAKKSKKAKADDEDVDEE